MEDSDFSVSKQNLSPTFLGLILQRILNLWVPPALATRTAYLLERKDLSFTCSVGRKKKKKALALSFRCIVKNVDLIPLSFLSLIVLLLY